VIARSRLQTSDLPGGGGLAGLTNPGAIPMVGAVPGTLEESALTDDGATVSSTEPVIVDTGAAPQDNQCGVRANALGFIGLLCSGADNSALDFDVELSGGSAVARDASVVIIRKNADLLKFQGSVGNVVGGAATLNLLGALDLATGRWGLGNVGAPGYSVDAELDVNAAGVFRVAGTQVVGARQADPGTVAAAPSVSASNTTQTADGVYSANEQQMLGELKTAIANMITSLLSLETQVNNLRTDRDNLRAVLQAHGLMA
jgi:hypothetical protein